MLRAVRIDLGQAPLSAETSMNLPRSLRKKLAKRNCAERCGSCVLLVLPLVLLAAYSSSVPLLSRSAKTAPLVRPKNVSGVSLISSNLPLPRLRNSRLGTGPAAGLYSESGRSQKPPTKRSMRPSPSKSPQAPPWPMMPASGSRRPASLVTSRKLIGQDAASPVMPRGAPMGISKQQMITRLTARRLLSHNLRTSLGMHLRGYSWNPTPNQEFRITNDTRYNATVCGAGFRGSLAHDRLGLTTRMAAGLHASQASSLAG